MLENTLPILIGRLDFGWITTFHILYPPLTIGLAATLFFAEAAWLKTGDERWYRLCRFFERLLIINFSAGVATGVTMEMAFGILYGPFAQAAGPFFGQVLGYETITAFMYEAGFIGLMIFGWGKIGRKMHLFATFNVALSATLSSMWILDANSWMQTPTGVAFENGAFVVKDWGKALLNPDVIYAWPHMLVACWELALCVVIAVSAYYCLKKRHVQLFQRSLKYAVIALVVVAPVQIYLGDGNGLTVKEKQPAVLAAMEGHWRTYNKDGSPRTGWNLLAWPNDKGDANAWAITFPHVLSILENHKWVSTVQGLNDFKPEDRPMMLVPFYAFRVMVGCAFGVFMFSLWGAWLAWRKKLTADKISGNKLFLCAAIANGFLPYIAVWTGWWTREVGRQPYVAYGMMRTTQGISHMGLWQEIFWLVGYMSFELTVWGATWWFLGKLVYQGPILDTPIPEDGSQSFGSLPKDRDDKSGTVESPKAARPAKPGRFRPA